MSATSLRRWTDEGRLSCLRVGRRRERRFRRADLVAFMEHEPASRSARAAAQPLPPPQHALVGGLPVPYGSHFAALYASDAGRTKLAVAFLADGLGQGSAGFFLTSAAGRAAVRAGLEGSGRSPRPPIDEGRLVLSEYAGSGPAQLESWEAAFVAATRAGARSLRVVGDVWGLAERVAPEAVVEYEDGYDRLQARFPVVTMCQYDVRRFTSLQIFEALRQHGDCFRYPVDRFIG